MKSEKGITLISLTVYVIVMVIVVAALSVITGYVYKNIDVNTENDNINKQYTKFESFFSEDINKSGNKIAKMDTEENENSEVTRSYVVFTSGNQYTFLKENSAIYCGKAKIAEYVESCIFERTGQMNQIKVTYTLQGKDEKNRTYTLKD